MTKLQQQLRIQRCNTAFRLHMVEKREAMERSAGMHQRAIDEGQAQTAKQRFNRAANYFPKKACFPYGKDLVMLKEQAH